MIHYGYTEFSLRKDTDQDQWYILTLDANLAIRMGYHRDPRNFKGIMPLEAERRRGVWACIMMGDVLVSTQMVMPRVTRDRQCNTADPSNFDDADLDDGMAVLPSPKPETEITTSLGLIARKRSLDALGAVSDLTTSAKPPEYEEVLQVDRMFHAAAASIPKPLKMKPMAANITDTPQVVMSRSFLNVLLQKGLNILHRRYLYAAPLSPSEDTYAFSTKACVDAGLEILRMQQILDEETAPGGQLQTLRWRISSILNHQFLTATMILCSAVYRGQMLERGDEILATLRIARATWLRGNPSSREAQNASRVVNTVLARADNSRDVPNRMTVANGAASAEAQPSNADPSVTMPGEGCSINFNEQALFQSRKTWLECKTSLADSQSEDPVAVLALADNFLAAMGADIGQLYQ